MFASFLASVATVVVTAVPAVAVEVTAEPAVAYDAPTVLVDHHGDHDPNATVGIYGVSSGFAKARLGVDGVRKSITVGHLPGLDYDGTNLVLDHALDEWNRAAGWELFILDTDGVDVDVSFLQNADETCPNYGACTGWDQFSTGWYRHCNIMLHEWEPPLRSTYAHELGHCLGFEDVPTSDSGYFGIMSYARPATLYPNNEQDQASLAAVGYRVAA